MALMTEAWRCTLLLPLLTEENVRVRFPPRALLCMPEKLLFFAAFARLFLLVCFGALGKICA